MAPEDEKAIRDQFYAIATNAEVGQMSTADDRISHFISLADVIIEQAEKIRLISVLNSPLVRAG